VHGTDVPLCVDLDGTLIRSDTLWESVVQLWRRPATLARALLALACGGKAAFKAVVAAGIDLEPAHLPYREEVLAFVKAQRDLGREVVLATAAHRTVAERVAAHLGMFSRVLATDGKVNLSGVSKRAALESCYGARGFDYIGDDLKDVPIFASAREALLVEPSAALLRRARAQASVSRVFSESRGSLAAAAHALRLHQWAKNVLLAVPLLTAHVTEAGPWVSILLAFLAFGCVASATYLVNDLVDLGADRAHPRKRYRALASGRLSIQAALALAAGLAASGLGLSVAVLPGGFSAYLILYTVLTLAYSLDLKRRLLVDALALSVLYTLRILAGGAAVGVAVSEWLLIFSLFIFVSLAFLKRFVELDGAGKGHRAAGRGYYASDLETIRVVGVCAGLLSVLVLALYVSSPNVTRLYRAPELLWFMCPLLIYWVARMWFLAARGQVHHDPVVFALIDWRSYVVGALAVAVGLLATAGAVPIAW
jgi:4-hydroxybenzoate polyprenyltransferase/phosphoserine phosphatase